MPIAEVNGQRLNYDVMGDGEPLLCLHGLACDTLAWIPQLETFAAAHRTVVFDNRDVGQSSMAAPGYEIADMASHTLTLAVTFPAGGNYATRLAEVWSNRVRQISHEQHVDELMLLNHSEAFFDNPDMVAFIRTAMLNNPYPQPPEAFARQLSACSRHDTRARLGALTMPTHVIGGEFDILVPLWKSREIASLIPDAKLTVLPEAPHGLSLERAEEFNAAVLGFIREAAATSAA